MNKIRGLVVGVLLAVWCFPALSSAKGLPPASPPPPAFVATGTTETGIEGSFVDGGVDRRAVGEPRPA